MTTITTTAVAPNELIESAWGNAVRTDVTNLNADKLELAGGTMTGHLLGITPTSAAHLTRKDYVDGVVAGLLSTAGGTITGGSITIATSGQGVNLPAGEPSSAARAARKDYVDTQVATRLAATGGTITGGSITIATSGQGIALPTGEPSAANRAARKDYVDTGDAANVSKSGDTMTGLLVATTAGVTVPTSPPGANYATPKTYVDTLLAGRVATAGDTMTGALYMSSTDITGEPTSGAAAIQAAGRFMSSVNANNIQNVWLKRYGSNGAISTGQDYIAFIYSASNTQIGSIDIASSTTVGYRTTSDPRLKVRTGDAADASAMVQHLGRRAFHGHFTADEEQTDWVFLSSHDIEDVAPFLVVGERDAVDDNGNVKPQLVDFPNLVPTLTAALAQALDRIDALEAAA